VQISSTFTIIKSFTLSYFCAILTKKAKSDACRFFMWHPPIFSSKELAWTIRFKSPHHCLSPY